MAKSVQDIMNLIQEKGIRMVDFKIADINGQYRHVTIPAENFSEDTMKSAIGFDASTMVMPWWKRATWSSSPLLTPPSLIPSATSPPCP